MIKITATEAWNTIISSLVSEEIDVSTDPQIKKIPIWFSAKYSGNKILIGSAKFNKPTSKLSQQRSFGQDEFERVFPYYLKEKITIK